MARWAMRPTCRPSMLGTIAVVLEVEPGRERSPGSGEHDHPGVVLVGDRLEGRVQLGHQLDRHRVEPVGAVHPHDGDVRTGVLHEHEGRGVGHGRERSGFDPPARGAPRRVGPLRRSTQGDHQWPTSRRPAPPSRTTSSRTARSRRRPTSGSSRWWRRPFLYDEANEDWQGFWARQAADLLDWDTEWHTILEWDLPVRQVVRRRHAQRLPQRRRPARAGRPGRQGGVPLGGRARRHPHDHLRRPPRRRAAVRQRAEGPRRRRRATASASTCR